MDPEVPKARVPAELAMGRLDRQLVWQGMEGSSHSLSDDVIKDASSYTLERWQEQSFELFSKMYREQVRRLIRRAEASERALAWTYVGQGHPAASRPLMQLLESLDTQELWIMQREAEALADRIEGVLGRRESDKSNPDQEDPR